MDNMDLLAETHNNLNDMCVSNTTGSQGNSFEIKTRVNARAPRTQTIVAGEYHHAFDLKIHDDGTAQLAEEVGGYAYSIVFFWSPVAEPTHNLSWYPEDRGWAKDLQLKKSF
jgi:hypothetical protein